MDSCKAADCTEATESCQGCLLSNLPNSCSSLNNFPCFSCVKSIVSAYVRCEGKPNVLQCMIDSVPESCASCICSLACELFGPDSFICKVCRGDEVVTIDGDIKEYSMDSCTSCVQKPSTTYTCPFGWTISRESPPKCYQAVNDAVTWDQAGAKCKQSNANANLAISDTPTKINVIYSVMQKLSQKTCWLSAQQPPATNNKWFWIPPSPAANIPITNFNQYDLACPPTVTGKCLTVQRSNGQWCYDDCDKQSCYVCEMDATAHTWYVKLNIISNRIQSYLLYCIFSFRSDQTGGNLWR